MPLAARRIALLAGALAASSVGAADALAQSANLLANGSFDGALRTHYRRMAYLGNGDRGRVTVELALNDRAGPWVVEATDVATGVKATATVNVK